MAVQKLEVTLYDLSRALLVSDLIPIGDHDLIAVYGGEADWRHHCQLKGTDV